jgi:hypothetical protein
MDKFMRTTSSALENDEVKEAARILAKYDLGICLPHIHDQSSGTILPLPAGIVACERDLRVSFESVECLSETMLPVAWRWTANGLEPCASCCAGPSPR